MVTSNARTMVRVERRPKAKAYMRLHTSLVRAPRLASPLCPVFTGCFATRLRGSGVVIVALAAPRLPNCQIAMSLLAARRPTCMSGKAPPLVND